ncbi:hypothetical protein K3556_02285 [Aliiroseovarius sp. M344]|uniref:DUF6414 family protein n=1 Tax=Aliiroseovarius sp. M344 TaxID=2867010 RepID=UPI0021ADE90D|nr:hypothetical protein [Aliiroseovarius sp. M344]UWQ14744.1 hypothetical protein K3556_02285 [Aliiroseovarius sp. M344]
MEKLSPIIPIYLNQNYVFDLLAMLKDGLSTVTSVTETSSSKASSSGEAQGNIGLGSMLTPLLKIDLSARRGNSKSTGNEQTSTQERVHTPASMLQSLRQELREADLLSAYERDQTHLPKAGELIEITVILKRNPFIELMDTMLGILPLAMQFASQEVGNKKIATSKQKEVKELLNQMNAVRESLTQGNTIDLFSELGDGTKTIITVDQRYLDDAQMANLIDGEYKILGKVSRAITSNDAPLSLLRKTPVSKLPVFIDAMKEMSDSLLQSGDFTVPEGDHELEGPAIHILPIAIFV